jgi:Putative GTPase activating protein for Arf
VLEACYHSLDRQKFTQGGLLFTAVTGEEEEGSSSDEDAMTELLAAADDAEAESAASKATSEKKNQQTQKQKKLRSSAGKVVVVMVSADQRENDGETEEVDEVAQLHESIDRLMERARLPVNCAANLEMVARLVRTRSNRKCADCNSTDLCAVSTSLGVFLCDPCAVMHQRVLPVYVSEVHALPRELLVREVECSLPEEYAWISDTSSVIYLSHMGSRRANKHWEAQASQAFTSSFNKPAPDSNEAAREKWIKGKYLMQLFASMVEGELEMTVFTGKKLEKKEVKKRWARLKKNGLCIYPSISHPEPERVLPMNGCMIRPGGIGEPSTFELTLRNVNDAQAIMRASKSKKNITPPMETIKFNAGKSGRAMQWVFALGRAGCNIIKHASLEDS